MNYFLTSRSAALIRKEIIENKVAVLLGPIVLVIAGVIAIIFTALFVDRVGTFFGGRLIGEFIQGLEVSAADTGRSLEIKLSDIEGGFIYMESLEASNDVGSLDGIANTKTTDIDENFVGDSFKLNEIFYYLHKLLMLVPLFISINYLLGSLLYDRLDGSYFFWRSMPVSPKEEIISKVLVALFLIPLTFVCASFLIQILSLLIFIFPIYRIGLDPILVISNNLDISDWFWFVILDWLDRGIMLAPIFSFAILASALAKRSAMFVALLAVVSVVFLEHVFWGSNNVIGWALHYLPWPISDDIRIIDNPTRLVVGLIVACLFIAIAIHFRVRPVFVKD